jgi:hypothetical protein
VQDFLLHPRTLTGAHLVHAELIADGFDQRVNVPVRLAHVINAMHLHDCGDLPVVGAHAVPERFKFSGVHWAHEMLTGNDRVASERIFVETKQRQGLSQSARAVSVLRN